MHPVLCTLAFQKYVPLSKFLCLIGTNMIMLFKKQDYDLKKKTMKTTLLDSNIYSVKRFCILKRSLKEKLFNIEALLEDKGPLCHLSPCDHSLCCSLNVSNRSRTELGSLALPLALTRTHHFLTGSYHGAFFLGRFQHYFKLFGTKRQDLTLITLEQCKKPGLHFNHTFLFKVVSPRPKLIRKQDGAIS